MKKLRKKLYTIVFKSDTFGGKLFDILLLVFILTSIVVVLLESVKDINQQHGLLLKTMEWSITLLFTFEYLLRIVIVSKPKTYIFSFPPSVGTFLDHLCL